MSWLTRLIEMFLGDPGRAPAASDQAADHGPIAPTTYGRSGHVRNQQSAPIPPPSLDPPDAPGYDAGNDAGNDAGPADEENHVHAPRTDGGPFEERPEISVLVATFKNDREGGFTSRVINTLETAKMLVVSPAGAPLPSPGEQPLVAKLIEFQADARKMMEDANADLLIFGEVAREGLRLHLVAAGPAPEGRADAFAIGDVLKVPHNFGAELANLLYASVLAAGLQVKTASRRALAPYLIGAAEQSLKLLESLPEGLDQSQVGSIYTHLGVAAASLWRLGKKPAGLTAAVAAFEKATREGPKELTPLVMAELKLRLGAALQELALHNDDDVMFEDALDAFEAVAKTLKPANYPREWGIACLSLGTAYLTRGKKDLSAEDCARATSAFDAALKVFSKEKDPPRWLDVMTMKGTALMTAGAINAGVKDLEQAADVMREVLAARNRATQPIQWAQASNGLGSAMFALAKRTNDRAKLDEAIQCYDGALSVYERNGEAVAIGVVRKNQQRAHRLREGMGG